LIQRQLAAKVYIEDEKMHRKLINPAPQCRAFVLPSF